MKEVKLDIGKNNVFDEIGKLTAYVGAKNSDEKGLNTYDRVFTTEDDVVLLERYWREGKSELTELLKPFIRNVDGSGGDVTVDMTERYRVTLQLPDGYPLPTIGALNDCLFSFLVNHITAKWFAVTNKGDAEYYAALANNLLTQATQNLYYRVKPIKK